MDHARSLRDDRGMGSVVVVEQGEEDQIHEEELTVRRSDHFNNLIS